MRRRLLWIGATLLLGVGESRADTCGPVEGFDAVFPVPGSVDVPVNARVRVRFPLGESAIGRIVVEADGETVEGMTCPGDAACPGGPGDPFVGAREYAFEPALSFLPPGATLRATAPRSGGGEFEWTFETGDDRDDEPPLVEPPERANWEWLGGGPDDDPCGPEGLVRYQISIWLPPAVDRTDRQNVEYHVFRMNGPDLESGPNLEGISLDDGSGDSVEARIYLPGDEEYARRLCFIVSAVDVVGNSAPIPEETCLRLEEGPFFRSICSVSPGSGRAGHPTWSVVAGAALLVAVRRVARGWRRARGRKP